MRWYVVYFASLLFATCCSVEKTGETSRIPRSAEANPHPYARAPLWLKRLRLNRTVSPPSDPLLVQILLTGTTRKTDDCGFVPQVSTSAAGDAFNLSSSFPSNLTNMYVHLLEDFVMPNASMVDEKTLINILKTEMVTLSTGNHFMFLDRDDGDDVLYKCMRKFADGWFNLSTCVDWNQLLNETGFPTVFQNFRSAIGDVKMCQSPVTMLQNEMMKYVLNELCPEEGSDNTTTLIPGTYRRPIIFFHPFTLDWKKEVNVAAMFKWLGLQNIRKMLVHNVFLEWLERPWNSGDEEDVRIITSFTRSLHRMGKASKDLQCIYARALDKSAADFKPDHYPKETLREFTKTIWEALMSCNRTSCISWTKSYELILSGVQVEHAPNVLPPPHEHMTTLYSKTEMDKYAPRDYFYYVNYTIG